MTNFVSFFTGNFPSLREFLVGFPPFFCWAFCSLFFAGLLKQRYTLKTGYTRKIFHFLIFTNATGIQVFFGLKTLCLFGAATSGVILYALLKGDGHLLYEAMAREKDAPHRSYYIIAPYAATFLGGVFSNVFFGYAALVGYLVTGLGDAIGEPVGTRFGKHRYCAPSFFAKVPSTRSYEGSLAVFLVSLLAGIAAFTLSPELEAPQYRLLFFIGLAACSALVEALSPHGWDNAAMQLVPAFYVWLLG